MTGKKLIAIGFDGVLHNPVYWKKPEVLLNGPVAGAKVFLEELQARGYQIVVFTTRDIALVQKWLENFGFAEFIVEVVDKKPSAIAYVDDRAVRFDGNFVHVLNQIELRTWWEWNK